MRNRGGALEKKALNHFSAMKKNGGTAQIADGNRRGNVARSVLRISKGLNELLFELRERNLSFFD